MEQTSEQFKQKLTEQLQVLGAKCSRNERLQVSINLDISPATFERYTSGDVIQVRRLELADSIIAEIKKVKNPELSK